MNFTIGIIIGAVGGILFSFSFPEVAVKVNDFVAPFVKEIFEYVVNAGIEFIGSGNFTQIGLVN